MKPPTGPAATDGLVGPDHTLWDWLRAQHLTDSESQAVVAWWNRERDDNQTLAQFLMSRQVLCRSVKVLPGRASSRWRFTVHGLELLRALAAEETSHIETVIPPSASMVETVITVPSVGSTLGRCLLTEQIGRGGMGVVFRALHWSLNVPVAVKVLDISVLARDPKVAHQIQSEAHLLARLNHPHVVRVWDFDNAGPFPFLVLEYVNGLSLNELIQQSGRLLPERALRLIGRTAEGLAAADRLGIVHRDVKPSNILVAKDGSPKLADLGMAIVVESGTKQGGVAGTVAYMAPEQAHVNAVIDHRADIYALGATLYHAITGQLPFPASTRGEVLHRHATDPLRQPPGIDIPPRVWELIERMMAKQPQDRFATYNELIDTITRIEAELNGIVSKPAPPPTMTAKWVNFRNKFGGNPPS